MNRIACCVVLLMVVLPGYVLPAMSAGVVKDTVININGKRVVVDASRVEAFRKLPDSAFNNLVLSDKYPSEVVDEDREKRYEEIANSPVKLPSSGGAEATESEVAYNPLGSSGSGVNLLESTGVDTSADGVATASGLGSTGTGGGVGGSSNQATYVGGPSERNENNVVLGSPEKQDYTSGGSKAK
ncbi:MAG: hypothetical protein HC842_02610 [Cytophagales bacterium]|nr:hypothetical protein [Cytophagales bacterium]